MISRLLGRFSAHGMMLNLDGRHTELRKFVWRAAMYLRSWAHRRVMRNVSVVGITGSAGKTTTKELCALILSDFGSCVASTKSENSRFSVALKVLEIQKQHRFCVVELSAHKPGHLDLPLRLTKPCIAVLTVIGRDHYSAFESVEAIAQEKGKLVRALPANGVAVLNVDDPRVRAIGEACGRRVIWVGRGEGAELRLLDVRSNWPEPLTLRLAYRGETHEVRTQLHGTHLALSVLASLGVALALDLPLVRAIEVVRKAQAAEGRMQLVHGEDGVVFVRDDMKAPHWSLTEPLAFIRDADAERKVAVIGTVSDVSGDDSKKYRRIAKLVREFAHLAVFVGPNAHRALRARRDDFDQSIQGFPDTLSAAEYLRTELRRGDLVLVKGSNTVDHLVRLVLDRESPVGCWRERCGRQIFCGDCNLLYAPSAGTAEQVLGGDGGVVAALARVVGSGEVRPAVIVGLGNPGARYDNTPHNAGFWVLDELAGSAGGAWETDPDGEVCVVECGAGHAVLFKPGVNVNLSGEVVRRFLARVNGAVVEHCLVVHDDMDLALGDVRSKRGGGDAGHKGVRSITAALGSAEFERIRIGVRRSGDVRRALDLVLVPFAGDEAKVVSDAVGRALTKIHERVNDRNPGERGQGAAVATSTLAETPLVASGRESGKVSNSAAALLAPNVRER